MRKLYYILLGILLIPQLAYSQDINLGVTSTPAFCGGDGEAVFSISNAQVGATIDFSIYRMPEHSIPYRLSANIDVNTPNFSHTETGLEEGTYSIVGIQNFEGDLTPLPIINFTISSNLELINAQSITFSSITACDNKQITTVNISGNGRPKLYELRDRTGQVIFPFQESNELPPIENGEYRIAVEDECGNITVKDFAVNLLFIEVRSSWVDFNKLTACNKREDFKIRLTGRRGVASSPDFIQDYQYPIQVVVEMKDANTETIIHQSTHTVNNQAEAIAGVSLPGEFNPGDILTTNVTVTDACGEVYSDSRTDPYNPNFTLGGVTGDCNKRYLRLSSFIQYYADAETTIEFIQYPSDFKPWEYNDDFVSGEYSHTYSSLTDAFTSGSTVSFGDAANSVPEGFYEVKVTNDCGAEQIKTTNITYLSAPNVNSKNALACEEGWYMQHFYYNNNSIYNITGVTILEAPQAFINEYGPLPFDAEDYIVMLSGKYEFRMELPEGDYKFQITNSCGDVEIRNMTYAYTQELLTSEVNYERHCGGYFTVNAVAAISNVYIANITVSGITYVLQKWYPAQQEWGHPDTEVTGSIPNQDNSMLVSSYYHYYNSGEFRVLALPHVMTENSYRTCYDRYFELDQFNIPAETIALENFYTAGSCVNGKYNLMVDAVGIDDLTYEITHKDGQEFHINNANDPVFMDLLPGTYTLKITDSTCGDALTTNLKVVTNKLPVVRAQDLCEGEDGRLYVNGASYLSIEWYKDGVATGVTGHSYYFTPYDSALHNAIYEAHLSYPSNPNFCFGGDVVLSFDLTTADINDAYAGEGQTVTLYRNDGPFDLFDYLDGTYNTWGEWEETSSTLSYTNLNESIWLVSKSTALGTYTFTYTVDEICGSGKDTTTVTIHLKDRNSRMLSNPHVIQRTR